MTGNVDLVHPADVPVCSSSVVSRGSSLKFLLFDQIFCSDCATPSCSTETSTVLQFYSSTVLTALLLSSVTCSAIFIFIFNSATVQHLAAQQRLLQFYSSTVLTALLMSSVTCSAIFIFILNSALYR